MPTQYGFNYKQYRLHCDPMPMQDGRFGAQVIISNEVGDVLVERRFPALDYFPTEAEAVEHARKWGEGFIDAHG